jgi:hypothetical protein
VKSIYCGLGRKPPGSAYGNRLQCMRKGWALGSRHIRT